MPLPKLIDANGPRLILLDLKIYAAAELTDLDQLFQVVNTMQEIFIMEDP